MEQKQEQIQAQEEAAPGGWQPRLDLEDVPPPISQLPGHDTALTNPEIPLLVSPITSGMILSPAYYAPTELNQCLAGMQRDTPLREAFLIVSWTCILPLLLILFLILLPAFGWGALGCAGLMALLFRFNRLI